MSDQRHVLIIVPWGESLLKGVLTLEDGTDLQTFRNERAQIIAWAQAMIEAHNRGEREEPQPETLILDHAGEIVRDEHFVEELPPGPSRVVTFPGDGVWSLKA